MAQSLTSGQINVCNDVGGRLQSLKAAKKMLEELREEGAKKQDLTECVRTAREVEELVANYLRDFHPLHNAPPSGDDVFWSKEFFGKALLAPGKPLFSLISEQDLNQPMHIFEKTVKGSSRSYLGPRLATYLADNPEKIPEEWKNLANADDIGVIFWGGSGARSGFPNDVRMLLLRKDRRPPAAITVGPVLSGFKLYSAVMP